MRANRTWLEPAAFLAVAFACALVSNALAGPARRLAWLQREVSAAAPAVPAAVQVSVAETIPGPSAAPQPAGAPPTPAKPIAASKPPAEDLLARFPPLVEVPQAELNSDDALWLHAHGARFLDARRSAAYAQGHISGARSLPAWEDGLAEKVEQLSLFTPDLKAPVVVYCSGGDCQDSHLLAQKLWVAGFRNLRIYTDGFPDWEAKARPTSKGEQP